MNRCNELFQPANTWIGVGVVERIPEYISKLGVKKALIVTDGGLLKSGVATKVLNILDQNKLAYVLFSNVLANPTIAMVDAARECCQKEKCDYIIGIGGGSPLDVSKAVSILMANGGNIKDYEGVNRSSAPGMPLIAINTTAGTGSEVTKDYVITDEERKIKMLMVDPHCMARLAVNDPQLMIQMPPTLTVATGMDALTHAVEAYTAKSHSPYTDALALGAVSRIVRALPRAVENGNDLVAREEMCWAEYMAGLSFSNAGLGMVHAMAHQLGGFYNIPHGVANAALLPYVMNYNRLTCRNRYAELASCMGIRTENMSADQSSLSAILYIRKLSDALKIPNLKSLGFHPSDVMQLSANAVKDTCMSDNPRSCGVEDVRNVFMQAYEGVF